MKGKNIILVVCAALLLAVATVWIILPAFAYKMSSLPGISVRGRKVALSSSDGAYKLTGVTRETSQGQVAIELPTILKGVPPRTAITLKAQIAVGRSDSLLVKSVFTPMRIYLDGELAYAYGEEGSYPSFLNDPPTNLFILPLPQNGEPVSLRIEYLSPSQRSEISLPALYVGSEGELFANLVHANGFSFVFSCVLLFLGTAMIFPYVLFLRHVSGGSSFLWLGLFSLSAGMWIMGECDLSVFIFPYPSLLHAIDYLGLLFLTFPFLCFGMVVLNPQNPRPFTIMLAIHVVSLLAAITLQLCGAVDLIRTLYWFHIITPLGFLVFAADLLWEYFRYKNAAAKRFVPAVGLLTIAVLLELLNYWLKGNSAFTVIFQFGLLTFIVSLGIVSGYYVRQSMRAAGENLRLEYEMGVMERQLALQQEQYGRMMQNAHEIRTMRHDMRHHLAALGQLLDSGGAAEKAKTYLESLKIELSEATEQNLCENYAVNAIAAHYLSLAAKDNIAVEARLEIPEDTGCIPAVDLCIIMGNFLENALEACRRMKGGETFIRIKAMVRNQYLVIVMDNSFDGLAYKHGKKFLSRKRAGGGVGLSSISVIAEKHGGSAAFHQQDNVFSSSVMLKMELPGQ